MSSTLLREKTTSSELVVGLELGPETEAGIVGVWFWSSSRVSGTGFLGFRPRFLLWSTMIF